MKIYINQALECLETAFRLAMYDDSVGPEEGLLYLHMQHDIRQLASKYAVKTACLSKKNATPGVSSTEDGNKNNKAQAQYNTHSLEIQVIPWERLDISTRAILSDLCEGGEQL